MIKSKKNRYVVLLLAFTFIHTSCGPEDTDTNNTANNWGLENSPCKLLDKPYEENQTVCIENITHLCTAEGFVAKDEMCGEFIDVELDKSVQVRIGKNGDRYEVELLGKVRSVGTKAAVNVTCEWKVLQKNNGSQIYKSQLLNPTLQSLPVGSEQHFSDQWEVPEETIGLHRALIECNAENETAALIGENNKKEHPLSFD